MGAMVDSPPCPATSTIFSRGADVDDLSDVEALLVVHFALPIGLTQMDEREDNDALQATVFLEEGVHRGHAPFR